MTLPRTAVALCALFAASLAAADFSHATIVLPASASTPQKKAAQMLTEEIEKRTQLRLKIAPQAPDSTPAISLKSAAGGKPESFQLTSSANTISITGADDRGVIFGAGYLLRQFHMSRQKLELDTNLNVSS